MIMSTRQRRRQRHDQKIMNAEVLSVDTHSGTTQERGRKLDAYIIHRDMMKVKITIEDAEDGDCRW